MSTLTAEEAQYLLFEDEPVSEQEHLDYYLGEDEFQDYDYYPTNPLSDEE